MKKTSKRMIFSVIVVFSTLSFFFLVNAQGVQEWIAPAKYKTMKSPVSVNKENLSNGKELYNKHCKSCHGSTGLGDGPKAATLDVPCGDFTTKKFGAQSDGEIFYKLSEGKDKMPSFKKVIPDENDRWEIIQYIRTFKGK